MPQQNPQQIHAVLGSGPAGRTLAATLVARGHAVRTVDRGTGGGPVVPGAEHVTADLSDPAAAREALDGAAVAYHCVNVAYHLQTEAMPGIQRAVLEGAEAAGARLVVLDTLYPYGPTGGAVMTEDTPWNATTRKGRMRADLDERYLEAHRSGRVRVSLGRSADFYGPGVLNSSLGGAVFPGALSGGTVLGFGDLDLPHSYTYIGDVALGLALLGETPETDGRVWHLPTAPARTTREVHALIAGATGGPLKVEVMTEARPWGPFDAVFMDSYAELFYQHTEPQVMDSSAFERRFGTGPTPLEEGLSRTVAWYREQG
ncbi:NAD-dependent epimerase/dehydratase family protein [Streptomyces sp. NPDC048172]|uniref:NAD-dependent epimerase/dehydratase family protein n=1 Tax=Streptomyces sp. NPDC048172 TaxID=3365505 RepID=UPI00371107C1